jgi:ethanolamine-phosphate phospho-lyase
VGHQHPKVIEAVQRQVAALNSNTRYLHPNVALLAERIADLLPDPLEVVFFVNSGSEANDLALRLARAYSGTKNTIVVDRAYHGHTLAVTEISPYKFEKTREIKLVRNGPHMTPGPHIWKVPCPDTYRGKHRDPETAGALYADYVEEACHTYYRQRGEKVSAFIIESGMSVAGVVMPPKNYLIDAVNSVREAGGLFIADEVQTGFGRFGECYWGFQYQNNDNGVVPDIVTMAKPFGNGMPLAAVVTSRKVAQVFESVAPEYFNTFGGNPVCAAAGLAVLDVIESEQLQAKAAEIGGYLKTRFRELKERLDIIGDIRGSGFFVGIEFVRDRKSLEPATEETSFICTKLKEKHSILTSIDGPHDNVLVIKPPMVFSKADVDELVGCFEKVVVEDLAQVENIMSISKTPT